MTRYTPAEIEARWQKAWETAETFKAVRDTSKPKYYVLEMFPYPSGRIHIGHVRNYTMGDVIARYKLSTGHNVLHPMGFDAFGLPAEEHAIKNNASPREFTEKNIKTFNKKEACQGNIIRRALTLFCFSSAMRCQGIFLLFQQGCRYATF